MVARTVAAAAGRVPGCIAGAGSNNTATAVYLARSAERAGAQALLCVTPPYPADPGRHETRISAPPHHPPGIPDHPDGIPRARPALHQTIWRLYLVGLSVLQHGDWGDIPGARLPCWRG